MLASDRKLPVSGGPEKRTYVRDMFTAIAPTYDRLNRIISLGLDQRWRRNAVGRLGWERAPEGMYLDLCAGTLDFGAMLAGRPGFRGRIVGADFVQRMLSLGRSKSLPARAGGRRCAGPPVSGPDLRRSDGRMGRAEPGRPGRRTQGSRARAQARRTPRDPGDDPASASGAPAPVPLLLRPGVALDRPIDLETYECLYLASRVDPDVPRVRRSWCIAWSARDSRT